MSVAKLYVVALPPPPSANQMWKHFRGRMVRSAAYNSWLKEVVPIIGANIPRITGAVGVRLTLLRGSGVMRTSDLDNMLKPVLDALKPETRHKETNQVTKPGAGVIEDDNLDIIQRIEMSAVAEGKKSSGKRPVAELLVEVYPL